MRIAGLELEIFEAGEGAPLLFLHSGQGFAPDQPFVAPLAARRKLIVPSHPGFGRSSLPDWLSSVDDIAHIYLELLDKLGLTRIDIVGCSIGGWIAAEMASKVPERIGKLVLAAPMGVKTGPRDRLDIPDIFAMPQDAVMALMFHDPARMLSGGTEPSDEEMAIAIRNRETLALLSWEPWMHNPKLKHRLHRLTMPTLFLRGASDGMVSADYLDAYARLVPNAVTETIAEAGHALPIERPEAFAAAVLKFLGTAP
jgi:pimeloyl-ACP methyl ester carboxylesterase